MCSVCSAVYFGSSYRMCMYVRNSWNLRSLSAFFPTRKKERLIAGYNSCTVCVVTVSSICSSCSMRSINICSSFSSGSTRRMHGCYSS